MSDKHLAVVRTAYAAFNRGDEDAVAAALHPEVEWHAYLSALEGEIHRGPDAILAMWSALDEGFDGGLVVDLDELIDCGEQVVVAVVKARGTGRGSGARVEQRWTQLLTMRDGLIFRVEPFPSRTAALEAAGLSE